ncbi:MAG TPA: nuclear transport factor 2 family protein [Solirubrobacteraceae bacterium]|jgi:ketosteroid isomerase-like protein
MSQANVAVVKRGIDAWNSGKVDALRELYDPDVIVRSIEGWPEPGPYVGRDAVIRQWKKQREAFNADAIEVIGDYVAIGDRVAVRVIWRGAGSGPEANIELTALFTVRNDVVFATEFFWNHSDALKAVGLED